MSGSVLISVFRIGEQTKAEVWCLAPCGLPHSHISWSGKRCSKTSPRSIRRLLVLQKFLRGGLGRLDVIPVFVAAKVALIQFRTVVVYGFVKIIAPAQDAMFMHDKPGHRRDLPFPRASGQGPHRVFEWILRRALLESSVFCVCLCEAEMHILRLQRSSKSRMSGGMLCSSLYPTLSAVHRDPPDLNE